MSRPGPGAAVYALLSAVASLAPPWPAAAQGFPPGCASRDYVYMGARVLAVVDAPSSVTLGFAPPAGASVPESGSVTANVTLSSPEGPLQCPVTVEYATQDGTATVAGGDYTPVSGVLTFTGTTTSQPITVPITADSHYEPDETFYIRLSNPVGGTIGGGFGDTFTVTILNDDALPKVSVSDVVLAEGTGGTTTAVFQVSLSQVSGFDVDVLYSTADGTAVAPGDYTAVVNANVHIPAGSLSAGAPVTVVADAAYEPDETFFVNLSNATNAVIDDGQGQATLLNDDLPGLLIDDVRASEGQAGTTSFQFTVSLQAATTQQVKVDYQTANCTALDSDGDYQPQGETLIFDPGVTSRPVDITVIGDTRSEGHELFTVGLSSPVNASLVDALGQGSIENDDAPIVAPAPRADFNNDGNVDLLFNHAISGKVVTWWMVGVNRVNGLFLTPDSAASAAWKVVGTADFGSWTGSAVGPRDGKTDVLWRNETSGRLVVWLMDGTVRQAGVFVTPDPVGTSGKVQGTGNFTQAGPAPPSQDLLWRDDASGKMEAWAMDGVTRVGDPLQVTPDESDLNWQVVGTGDVNGDGGSDIWWRNAATGKLRVWQMSGVTAVAELEPIPGELADLNWRVQATPDLDRDGKADLLWRHEVSGNLVVWLMNGLTRTCGVFLNPASLTDNNWKVVGPR